MPKNVPTPQPESHWVPSDIVNQPSRDEVLSARRLVQESRARLGPDADVDRVHADLNVRGVELSRQDIVAVWDELT
jgi:hypothetical protein